MNTTQLTIKPHHQRFADHYIATGNVTASYLFIKPQSKHPKDVGLQLIKNPSIQKYIAKIQQQMESTTECTFEWKVNQLHKLIHGSSQKVDDKGIVLPQYANVMMNAIKELNLMQGHYAPEKHIVVNVDAPVEKIRSTLIEYDKY